jgi:hypothetical protein
VLQSFCCKRAVAKCVATTCCNANPLQQPRFEICCGVGNLIREPFAINFERRVFYKIIYINFLGRGKISKGPLIFHVIGGRGRYGCVLVVAAAASWWQRLLRPPPAPAMRGFFFFVLSMDVHINMYLYIQE